MWTYTTADWDPDGGQLEHEWEARLAADGWTPALSSVGSWVVVNTKRVKRRRLQRWVPVKGESKEASTSG